MFLLFCLALRKNDYEGDSEMIPLALVMRRTVREIKRKERGEKKTAEDMKEEQL